MSRPMVPCLLLIVIALTLPRFGNAQDNPPGKRYELAQETQPRTFRFVTASGPLPFNKPYAELTPEQREKVKSQYVKMEANDEPPFPERGLNAIYEPITRAQNKWQIEGEVLLDVSISATGSPTEVRVQLSPNKDVTHFVASVALLAKYKPGSCAGTPCAMAFPIRMHLWPEPGPSEAYLLCVERRGLSPDERIAACTKEIEAGGISARSMAEARTIRGDAWRDKGSSDKALADLDEAIRLDPAYARAFSTRGTVWSDKRDFERAMSDYNETLRLQPQRGWALVNRGLTWIDKGDDDRAIADFSEAIRLYPRFVDAWRARAIAWQRKSDTDHALADVDEALRVDPKSLPGLVQRADLRSTIGDDRAADDYDAAIRIDPKSSMAYQHRGVFWMSRGDVNRATSDFDEAIRLDAANAQAFFSRGVANHLLARYGAATADFAASDRLNPNNPYPIIWRALSLLRAGRTEYAQQQLRESLQSHPRTGWPASLISLLSGQMDASSLLSRAGDSPFARMRRDQLCEGHYYLGELELAHDRQGEGRALLKTAEGECPKYFSESYASTLTLKRLANE